MLALACPDYYTPEQIADIIANTCDKFAPAQGYTMNDCNGRARLENIAGMVDALHDDTPPAVRMQLTHIETFTAVYEALEWNNNHTANIAFSLAFGDADAVLEALRTVHYMGQNHAITAGAKYPTAV